MSAAFLSSPSPSTNRTKELIETFVNSLPKKNIEVTGRIARLTKEEKKLLDATLSLFNNGVFSFNEVQQWGQEVGVRKLEKLSLVLAGNMARRTHAIGTKTLINKLTLAQTLAALPLPKIPEEGITRSHASKYLNTIDTLLKKGTPGQKIRLHHLLSQNGVNNLLGELYAATNSSLPHFIVRSDLLAKFYK